MGFSFQQVDNYMIFSIYLFLERSNTKEGSMSVLLCVSHTLQYPRFYKFPLSYTYFQLLSLIYLFVTLSPVSQTQFHVFHYVIIILTILIGPNTLKDESLTKIVPFLKKLW